MNQPVTRGNKIRSRAHEMRRRVRFTRTKLERISRTATLGGLFLSFLKIGLVGFGGGVAVLAQIRTLTVRKRHWITDSEFAEAVALAQSLPGTSAGNSVTYIGVRLRGWRGATMAMTGFILPSMLIMIVLAIMYKHLHTLAGSEQFFHGLNGAVVALILVTAWRMGKNILTARWQWSLAVLAFLAVAILNATVLEVVFAAGLIGIYVDSIAERQLRRLRNLRTIVARRRTRIRTRLAKQRRTRKQNVFASYLTRRLNGHAAEEPEEEREASTTLRSIGMFALAMPLVAKLGLLLTLAAIFLRIGTVTFGGGLVMAPLIEAEVVDTHHWLTHQEFADAFALGQITPGPVLITATFVGYRVAGTIGALVATISIFLPAFLLTIAAASSLRRFRNNEQVQSFLRGVSPAVVGLLVAAALSMGRAGIHSWVGISIMLLAIFTLVRYRPNPFWVLLGAGMLRVVVGLLLA
ncbi:MAG TPA: chromate efflux transporter [Pyrinomonadaceae bacterium]|nr:chromate efflux transporter [Pyrinomonadaceae bacterium]